MGSLRRFADSALGQWFLSGVAALYIRVIYRSNRWERVGYGIADRLLAEHRRAIICFWHGRLLMMPFAMRGDRPFHILVSDHRDGRLIARTVERFGIGIITGSSSREPVQALYRVAEVCRAYGLPCVTPDGPRGPCMHAAMGAVIAAELADAVLVPVAYATSQRRIMQSWDLFHLPLPFGRGAFVVGEEIELPASLDAAGREALRLRLEDALNAVTREADKRAGHDPLVPSS